jgi:DNA-binding phage protein
MKTTPFEVRDHLKTPEEGGAYLEAILEDGDADLIASGLGDMACAIGAIELAPEPRLSRGVSEGAVTGRDRRGVS